jgi:hypothetical protein
VRRSLITALADCAANPSRSRAYRFLVGLSSDELQFIAEFLGGCILESGECTHRRGCAQCRSEDQELKLIVLREYLSRSGLWAGPGNSPALC